MNFGVGGKHREPHRVLDQAPNSPSTTTLNSITRDTKKLPALSVVKLLSVRRKLSLRHPSFLDDNDRAIIVFSKVNDSLSVPAERADV